MAAADLRLPPGFRFHPTDVELVTHYLCRKCAGHPIAAHIAAEIDLSKHDPWDLPALAPYGEKEWYFFTPRDRKYPNGSRPNRAAGSGYWKATGADKPIGHPKPAAIKKSLVFYSGKAPKGDKTNWIMHEYRLADVDRSARKKDTTLRLDDWVLCRIYNKKGKIEKFGGIGAALERPSSPAFSAAERKPDIMERPPPHTTSLNYYRPFDAAESVPGRPNAESSSSEHVASPELTCEREVQSHPKWKYLENSIGLSCDFVGTAMDGAYGVPSFNGGDQLPQLPDLFMYQPKAF